MNLLPLVAIVVGAYAALTGQMRAHRNPYRAYPGPPPSHALFGRLVGRYWWGADPPAEVVEAREARKHHKRGESLETQIDRELAHGRELRKQLDEHRDQVPNLRDYGLDKRAEFERDVAAHNREQQRLNDEYEESGRRRYALIARRQAGPKPAAARPGELFAVPPGRSGGRFKVERIPENYGRATWRIVDSEHDDLVVGEGILFAAQANATAAELNSGRKADSTEGAMRGREGRSLVTPEQAEAIRQGDDAKRRELEHVAELRQELRTLETLAPKMSEGAISPTQMNRMSTRQRNRYDKNMARRWQVEDELKELEKPPEQRESERQARESKAAEKARSDRLSQVESEIRFRESVHHRGIGASVKRNREIYEGLLREREQLGGAPAPKAPELESPVASIEAKARSGMSNRAIVAAMKREGSPVELNAVNGIVANMRAAEKSPEQRATELAESAARGRAEWEEQQAGFRRLRELQQQRQAEQRSAATGAPMDVNGADQYRITMSERRRYGSPVQVPVTYDRVGPHQWAMTVGKQRKAGTLSDGMVAQAVDLARSEGRLVSQSEKQTTWTTADAPPQGMSRAEFEKRLEPRPIGDGYAVRQDVAGSGWTLIYPSGETRSGLPSRADAKRRAEQHRAVTSPPAKRLWTEVHTTDTGQRWEVLENDAEGKPVTVLSGSSVSAEGAMEAAAGAKAAWERERAEHQDMPPRRLRDFLAETGPQGLERARQEERTGRIALRKEPPGHEETPAEWRARMERRQEEQRTATAAELKARTDWVPYLDSEAAGVRRTGPTYEELGDVEHRDSLASALDWASRVKWGAMRLELGKAGYKSKEAEDELAEFRKRAGELGYRIEHAHYGAGDRTWRFRVEKGALPPVAATAARARRTAPEFDDSYKGPRHTYGLSYRPLGSSTVPAGWIIQSNRTRDAFPFGTVQYSRELTPAELAGYQLTEVPSRSERPVAPAASAAKRQYEAGWKASERFGSSEGTGSTPLERADDRGAPPAWYHGYEDHASDRAKWATFENRSGETVHLPRNNPRWPRFPGRPWRKVA